MKRIWSKFAIILLSALMLCGMILSAAGVAPNIYLMAVNDKVLDVTAENMPCMVDNTLYIPYTMLSQEYTGTNLGVRVKYSAVTASLNVTNGVKTVTYDLRRNKTHLSTGETTELRAVTRGAMVFVPLNWISMYFGTINYSVMVTSYGTLIRLSNDSAILPDRTFVEEASSLLKANMDRLVPSVTPVVTPTPTDSPTSTPTPTPSVEPELEIPTYLAFRMGDYAEQTASLMEEANLRGLFLFTVEEIVVHDDFIRRLVARGHQVGLALCGSDKESCREQLQTGQELLRSVACVPLIIVSADELSSQEKLNLRTEGYAVWEATVTAETQSSEELFSSLKVWKPNRVEVICSASGYRLITMFFLDADDKNCRIEMALAPAI